MSENHNEKEPLTHDQFEEFFGELSNKAMSHWRKQYEYLRGEGLPDENKICRRICASFEEDFVTGAVKVAEGKFSLADWRREIRSLLMFNLVMPLVKYTGEQYIYEQINKEASDGE